MEFGCPECGQILRAPDHLRNPLVRCRKCGATFRPGETAEPAAVLDEPLPQGVPDMEILEDAPRDRAASSRRLKKKAGSGLGVIGLILFILIAQAPRLLRVFNNRPQPQPPPAQMNDQDLRELNDLLRQQPAAVEPVADPPADPRDPFAEPDEPPAREKPEQE